MRIILFLSLLLFPIAVNAQDDVYRCPQNVYFDEVVEKDDVKKNVLVRHNEVINVYHERNVKVNNYSYNPLNRRIKYKLPRNRRAICVEEYYREDVYEHHDCRKPCTNGYENVGSRACEDSKYDNKKWLFFFDFNSSYVRNKEELGHLIDYAKYYSGNIYIDAYGDEQTGNFYSNEEIAKKRANSVINYLIMEGIDPRRMYVRYIGCVSQPYGNNNLNRCVIVNLR